jgi:hypothetical protein
MAPYREAEFGGILPMSLVKCGSMSGRFAKFIADFRESTKTSRRTGAFGFAWMPAAYFWPRITEGIGGICLRRIWFYGRLQSDQFTREIWTQDVESAVATALGDAAMI